MKDYSTYILLSYGFTAMVLGSITLYTIVAYRNVRRALRQLEQKQDAP